MAKKSDVDAIMEYAKQNKDKEKPKAKASVGAKLLAAIENSDAKKLESALRDLVEDCMGEDEE